ncbi:MAG: hypothetical protein HYV97_07390 [Bdellovibrio sp.]|nr:hypothetical protein [Bdellovibrio sp.]
MSIAIKFYALTALLLLSISVAQGASRKINLFDPQVLEKIAQGPTLESEDSCDCEQILKYGFKQVFPMKNWQYIFVEDLLSREDSASATPKIKKQAMSKINLIKKGIKDSLILSGKKFYHGELGIYLALSLGGPKIDWGDQANRFKTDFLEIMDEQNIPQLAARAENAGVAMHLMMAHYQEYFSSHWGDFKGVRMNAEGKLTGIVFETGALSWDEKGHAFRGKLKGREVELFF